MSFQNSYSEDGYNLLLYLEVLTSMLYLPLVILSMFPNKIRIEW